jgi:hypothetical protein
MLKVNPLSSWLLSQVLLLPFILALIRWYKAEKTYYPFFCLLTLGVLCEEVSRWTIHTFHSNAAVVNIYGLIEFPLILFQFYCWNLRRSSGRWLLWMGLAGALVWIISNLGLAGGILPSMRYHLDDFDLPLYRILYPFVLVMLSVNEINLMITHENSSLYKNARFVICLAFIVFFLYQILYEGAFLVGQSDKTGTVSNEIISAFGYVNAFVNLLYLVGVILVPAKRDTTFERIFDQIRDEN